MTPRYEVRPIGYVDSPLVDPKTAPRQGAEGALTHGWCSTPTWRKPPGTSPSAPMPPGHKRDGTARLDRA